MAIREISLGHSLRERGTLTLQGESLGFSATFIANNNLQKYKYVKMLVDDEDPYFLGMKFFSDGDVENCLTLLADRESNSSSRRAKATGLYSAHPILKLASKVKERNLRTYEIVKDLDEDYFKIYLRPMFENRALWESRNEIKSGIGIYKYLDGTNSVIYIGKGNIRDRARLQNRSEWGITEIQYSILKEDEQCFKWEAFYLEEFLKATGSLPVFNRIKGIS